MVYVPNKSSVIFAFIENIWYNQAVDKAQKKYFVYLKCFIVFCVFTYMTRGYT